MQNHYTTITIRRSPSWNRTSVTGFKGRLTATDRGTRECGNVDRKVDVTNEVRGSKAPFGLAPQGGAMWSRTDNELTAAHDVSTRCGSRTRLSGL